MSTFDPMGQLGDMFRLRERIDALTRRAVREKADVRGAERAKGAEAARAAQAAAPARSARGEAPSPLYSDTGRAPQAGAHTVEEQIRAKIEAMMDHQARARLVEDEQTMEKLVRGVRAPVTVMFADIRGFTFLSSSLPPDRVFNMLNIFHSEMIGIIRDRHHGCIDKIMGDGIMAFFGLPYETERHAVDAARAAVAMQQHIPALNATLESRGFRPIAIGIGLNTGLVRAGFVTTDKQVSGFTIIGDAVNLAAKYESIAGRGEILAGRETMHELRGEFRTEPSDREVQIRGEDGEVRVHPAYRIVV